MAHAELGRAPVERPAASVLDRRHFLRAGAACAVPLVAWTGFGQGGWTIGAGGAVETDPVLDHVARELVRTYQGMLGVEGPKGEHLRAFAANIDLLAAHWRQNGRAERFDRDLRDAVGRMGREAVAGDALARYPEIAEEAAARYGFTRRARPGFDTMLDGIDRLQQDGLAVSLRRAAPGLRTLGDALDRRRAGGAQVHRVRQKMGDEYIGTGPVEGPILGCDDLKALSYILLLGAAAFGIFSAGAGAGILALLGEGVSIMADYDCAPKEEEGI